MNDTKRITKLLGFIGLCLLVPALLLFIVGPIAGLFSAIAAEFLWWRRFRFPSGRSDTKDYWYVLVGYAVNGFVIFMSVIKLLGVHL
jgi:hypothetical protein